MEVRESVNSAYAERMNTQEMRSNFLITDLFAPGKVSMTYSHVDRMITGGITPSGKTLEIPVGKEMGTAFFLERREMGIINIGGEGTVVVDGTEFQVGPRDGLYVGMGAKELVFASQKASEPAKFYFNSAPAHHTYPTRLVTLADSRKVALGSAEEGNKRVINQYLHPAVLKTCQLVMGMTMLEPRSMWNTMPVHTHETAYGGVSLFRYARGPGGVPLLRQAGRDAALGCPQRTGGDQSLMVDPFRGRNRSLHLHLGHGGRESGLRRHGPCLHGEFDVKGENHYDSG